MIPRRLPVFSIAFAAAYAVIYFLAVEWNWALFTYHPALGTFGILTTPAKAGPSMYWYGWITTAALGGAAVATVVSLLPGQVTRRTWSGLAWLVPACTILAFVFLLRGYFLR
jgi:hypothetical protein